MIFFLTESSEIELTGAQSIYPCLDSFELMITGSTIKSTDNDFLRIIRLFHSSDSLAKRDIRDLTYLKEYTVPFNNLLKLDCQSNIQFIVDSKIHCFQYVVRNLITEAIVESSKIFCFPTNQGDIDEFNRISQQIKNDEENHSNNYKINSLRTLQSSNELLNSPSIISNDQGDLNEFNSINSLILNCECNATTFITLQLNHIAHYFVYFTHGEFKLQINKCYDTSINNLNSTDNNDDDYLHNVHRNEISVNRKIYNKLDDDVCIVNLTSIPGYKRIKVANVEVNSLFFSSPDNLNHHHHLESNNADVKKYSTHDDINVNLRDGIFSISPLLPINNSTLFQYLHSSYLRIESKYSYSVKLILTVSHILDDETLESNLQLLHVIVAGIFAICLFTCCISTVICISAGRETDKVITSDIMENATMLSDTPATFAANDCNNEFIGMQDIPLDLTTDTTVVVTNTADCSNKNNHIKQHVSLSQFDLDDVDSMEMDYYDYHCSINGGKKTPLLRTGKDKLRCTSSEPATEEESAFNV